MKFFAGVFIVLFSFQAKSQEGFQLGLEASPAWNLSLERNTQTGIRSNSTGYGFNLGVPIKWWVFENLALQTGLTFEFQAFDVRFNGSLQSSNRHGSLHVPLMFNYALSGNWFGIFGAGVNYNIMNVQWTPVGNVNWNGETNSFQPYAGLGISTLMDKGNGVFELGVQGRFHFIDLYKGAFYSQPENINRILSFDLIIRYYLFNG